MSDTTIYEDAYARLQKCVGQSYAFMSDREVTKANIEENKKEFESNVEALALFERHLDVLNQIHPYTMFFFNKNHDGTLTIYCGNNDEF